MSSSSSSTSSWRAAPAGSRRGNDGTYPGSGPRSSKSDGNSRLRRGQRLRARAVASRSRRRPRRRCAVCLPGPRPVKRAGPGRPRSSSSAARNSRDSISGSRSDAARTSRRRVAAAPRRALGPRPGAAPGGDVAGLSGPVMRPCFAPGETPGARRRDRVPAGPEARAPTSGDVRCPRRPRRGEAFGAGARPAAPDSRGRSGSPPRSPPRDRIAARPPRRRGGSSNRGSSSIGLELVGGRRAPFRAALRTRTARSSSSSKPGSGRGEAGGLEGGAGRPCPRPRRGSRPTEGFGSPVLPRTVSSRSSSGPVSLGHAGRGAVAAALFGLDARAAEGGGWGSPRPLGAAGGQVGVERFRRPSAASSAVLPAPRGESSRSPQSRLPFAFDTPSPARPSRARWRARASGRPARAPRGGPARARTGVVRGSGRRLAAASRSSTSPSPNRRGISDRSRRPRTDRSGRSRSRSRSRGRSSAARWGGEGGRKRLVRADRAWTCGARRDRAPGRDAARAASIRTSGLGLAPTGRLELLAVRLVPIVVLRLDVRDVKEAVAADREIDEGGLDGRFEIDDLSLVDVAGVALVAGALDVQLFEDAVLDDRDAAFLGLQDIDQHFFFHAVSFQD